MSVWKAPLRRLTEFWLEFFAYLKYRLSKKHAPAFIEVWKTEVIFL